MTEHAPSPRRALLSVTDKNGLVPLATRLHEAGFLLLATRGTHASLDEAGLPVQTLEVYSPEGEVLGGRLKTLGRSVLAGVLARREIPEDVAFLERQGLGFIDVVVVNFYAFPGADPEINSGGDADLAWLDIGGPTLARAGAKNYGHVLVLTDPSDYDEFLHRLESGQLAEATYRRRLAARALARCSAYDARVAAYLSETQATAAEKAATGGAEPQESSVPVWAPSRLVLTLQRVAVPSYGENPHQQSAFYRPVSRAGAPSLPDAGRRPDLHPVQIAGPELSYNNWLDLEAGWNILTAFSPASSPTSTYASGLPDSAHACVIVKHTNPCGFAGQAASGLAAWQRAWHSNPQAAYGGVIGLNSKVTEELAHALSSRFFSLLFAPAFDPEAKAILTQKTPDRRLVVWAAGPSDGSAQKALQFRSLLDGFLVQTSDTGGSLPADWHLAASPRREGRGEAGAGAAAPEASLLRDLLCAWLLVRHVWSNAVVLVRGQQLVGLGAGQVSRIQAAELAVRQARAFEARQPPDSPGSPGSDVLVAASDGFFPFEDSLDCLAAGGVRAVVSPAGAKRQKELSAHAAALGLVWYLTPDRHFRHT